MEHLSIDGGEEYLPYARGRIKALQALGLPYAAQHLDNDDAEIYVRITPGHEFIRIVGQGVEILSGVTRKGTVIDKKLVEYRPTEQAWKYPLKKAVGSEPGVFHAEKRLAIEGQYSGYNANYFSGTMVKAVQVIMGYGKPKSGPDAKNGVIVAYDYRFETCHGMAKDAKGKWWLVEISRGRGVMAMRMPLVSGSKAYKSSKQDVLKECAELFGGVPSNKTFPTGAKLAAAIEAGTVKQLLPATGLADFYACQAYSPMMGWSFNPDGTEAHNTAFKEDDPTPGEVRGYHYRIDIHVGDEAYSASLTKVSDGKLWRRWTFDLLVVTKHGAHFDQGNEYEPMPSSTTPLPYGEVSDPVTIFVCHDKDGQLQRVRYTLDTTLNGVSSEFTCEAYTRPPLKLDPYQATAIVTGQIDQRYVGFYENLNGLENPPTLVGSTVLNVEVPASMVIQSYYSWSGYVYRQIFHTLQGYRDGFSISTILPQTSTDTYIYASAPLAPGIAPWNVGDSTYIVYVDGRQGWAYPLIQTTTSYVRTYEPTKGEQFCLPFDAPEVDTDTLLANLTYPNLKVRGSAFGAVDTYAINKSLSVNMKYVGPLLDLEPYPQAVPGEPFIYSFLGYIK